MKMDNPGVVQDVRADNRQDGVRLAAGLRLVR